jgi:hypothetical protein
MEALQRGFYTCVHGGRPTVRRVRFLTEIREERQTDELDGHATIRSVKGRAAPALLLVMPVASSDGIEGLHRRYLHIGRALMASARVLVAAPAASILDPQGIRAVEYSSERSLRTLVDTQTIALIPGSLFEVFPSLERATARLIVDLSGRTAIGNAGLRAGDFFLCASEAEREWWLKVLTENGRIKRHARRNGNIRRLIDVVGGEPSGHDATGD